MASVNVIAGRRWRLSRDNKNQIIVKYRCVLDSAIGIGSEGNKIAGVPNPKDNHPSNDKLVVSSVEYDEESSAGGEKIVIATVTYEPKTSESDTTSMEDTGEKYQVDEWGWDSGTEEKELLDDIESTPSKKKPVANSAGDIFDTMPRIMTPAPVFTKVMKFWNRKPVLDNNCKVNRQTVRIGSMVCEPYTLLCFVSEKRLFGDPDWNYAYTVQLKYKSNKVVLFGEDNASELGWDVGLADVGMREIDPDDPTRKRRRRISVIDEESQLPVLVTSPAMLDGNGYAVKDTDPDRTPRNLRFKAYERTDFPSWFYSEPTIEIKQKEDNEENS